MNNKFRVKIQPSSQLFILTKLVIVFIVTAGNALNCNTKLPLYFPNTRASLLSMASQPWVLVICGDLPEPIIVTVIDPNQWTVKQVKTEVEKKTKIPLSEQTIYYGKTPLLDDTTPLTNLKGIKNGDILCLTTSNIVIKVEHQDSGSIIELSIPRSEFDLWTTHMLHECICFKFGFPIESKHYIFSGATLIENDIFGREKIRSISGITNGCTMMFTPLKEVCIDSPVSLYKRTHIPPTMSLDFLSTKIFNERPLSTESHSFESGFWKGSWTLKVVSVQPFPLTSSIHQTSYTSQWNEQTSVTSQTSLPAMEIIHLPEHAMTPVFKLREIICSKFGLPINQQKIKVGEIVLEDWDEIYKPLLLRNYPTIYDSVTIHLEKSDPVMNIILKQPSKTFKLLPSENNLYPPHSSSKDSEGLIIFPKNTKDHIVVPPSSININNPDKMTIMTLAKIVSQCQNGIEYRQGYLNIEEVNHTYGTWSKKTSINFEHNYDTVKSTTALKDGCRVNIDEHKF